MGVLTDKERETVAVAAAIGAGCQPCTQHHVREALRVGLSPQDVERAIDDGRTVRAEGSAAVAAVGWRLLEVEPKASQTNDGPSGRTQVLTYIGAAAACNAGGLLAQYAAQGLAAGLSTDEMRGAVEVAATVKKAAATFLNREKERALGADTVAATTGDVAGASCCGPSGCEG